MRKQIVFITGSNIGGAERVTILYAKILKQAGFDVFLLLYQNGMTSDIVTTIPEDIPYEIVACRIRYLPFRLKKKLRALNPKIVFVSLFHVALSASLATYMLGKPYEFIVRDCNTPMRHGKMQIYLARVLFKVCDKLVAQTEEMRQQMIETYNVLSNKTVTINNPIDKALIIEGLKEKTGLDQHYCNYLTVGRVNPQKDYITLLKAFAVLRTKRHDSRLYIVGPTDDANYKSLLDKLIDQYQLQEYVFFEGFQSNPYKYIAAADVFVLSSEYEGLPNVLLEAMYLAKPIVATRCVPFVQQIIKEGINGYSTDVGDHVALAERMLMAPFLKGMEYMGELNKSEEKILELFKS